MKNFAVLSTKFGNNLFYVYIGSRLGGGICRSVGKVDYEIDGGTGI